MSHVIVRVWVSRIKKTSPGHASLAIHPHAQSAQEGYVSFAPIKSGSVYGPGKFYTLAHDLDEYDKPTNDGARGCWIGKIYGLDTDKMMKAFTKDNHTQVYSLFNECASQVHKYLQIGGGDKFATRWSRNALVCWSPDDVEDYARSIVDHTRHLGSTGNKVVGAGTVF